MNSEYNEKYYFLKDYIEANSKGKKSHKFSSILNIDLSKMDERINFLDSIRISSSEVRNVFKEIKIYAKTGFNNILIYGFGSKTWLLREFLNKKLKTYPKIVVDGLNPATSSKLILKKICKFVAESSGGTIDEDDLDGNASFKNTKLTKTEQQIEFLRRTLDDQNDGDEFAYERIILAINNLDGPSLRDESSINLLSTICSIPKITLIATSDNVKFPALLTPKSKDNFNFKFLQVHTMSSLIREVKSMEGFDQFDNTRGQEALQFVLRSLVPSQKGIIESLAKHYLENPLSVGLDHKALFKLCFENAVISNETQFKENLTEIIDHKIFKKIKNDRSKEIYQMDYPKQLLEKIVNKEFV